MNHIFASFFLFLFTTFNLHADGIPEIGEIPDMKVKRMKFTALIDDKDRIYAIGGDLKESGYWSEYSTVERYTPGDREWKILGRFQITRRGFAASLGTDGKIYIFSGQNAKGQRLTSVEIFDPSTGKSTLTQSKILPRWDFSVTSVGKHFYLIGGDNSIRIPYTSPSPPYPIDSLSQEFRGTGVTEYFSLDSHSAGLYNSRLNIRRYGHTAIQAKNGKIFVFGGRLTGPLAGESIPVGLLKIPRQALLTEAFDTATGKWEPFDSSYPYHSIPTGRVGLCSALTKNGTILAIGGAEAETVIKDRPLSVVESFNPNQGTWTTQGQLPDARAYCSALTTSSGRVVVLGGLGRTQEGTYFGSRSVFEYRNNQWK